QAGEGRYFKFNSAQHRRKKSHFRTYETIDMYSNNRGVSLKIDSIDVEAAITNARQLIKEETDLSPALRSSLEILLLLVTLLMHRLGLNSSNSSKPPSSDPNRKKKTRTRSKKPSGGQKGHIGTTLVKVDDPDDVKFIKIDRCTLPVGNYATDGFETRQVFDIDISRIVTEYPCAKAC
ncbi:MAG: hypothetical protein KZQ86_15950, partial [Candidatus Thiodiazotropha sp. (ex Lucinoma kastoroae)]|nr:hypothetical protein [Candidatus Thiodiazotropha sp. (ex Lucinoma kastoroae)]